MHLKSKVKLVLVFINPKLLTLDSESNIRLPKDQFAFENINI